MTLLCAYCGEPIPRTTEGGQHVKPSAYAKRTYCSNECHSAARKWRAKNPDAPMPGVKVIDEPEPAKPSPTAARMLTALAEYDPVPLTADELVEEIRTTRGTLQTIASKLARQGRIRRWTYEGQSMFALQHTTEESHHG